MAEAKTAFELWIHYLREVPFSQWAHTVQRDFAGCLEAESVEEWLWRADYERGLFWNSDTYIPAAAFLDSASTQIPGRTINLVIDAFAGLKAIEEAVTAHVQLFRADHGWSRKKDEPERRSSEGQGLYRLATEPNIEALSKTLCVYRLRKQHPDEDTVTIAARVMEMYPVMNKHRGHAKTKDQGGDAAVVRKALQTMVSDELARAKELLSGVAQGIFPAPRGYKNGI